LNHIPLQEVKLAHPLARLLLSPSATYKIGFPGWPEPNLDSVLVFWGVSLEKGACTSPLFHSPGVPYRWLAGAGSSLPASVSSKWFSSEGLSVRPSFFALFALASWGHGTFILLALRNEASFEGPRALCRGFLCFRLAGARLVYPVRGPPAPAKVSHRRPIRNLAPVSPSPVRQPPCCTRRRLSQTERPLLAVVSKPRLQNRERSRQRFPPPVAP
jgi:hypothetical protein